MKCVTSPTLSPITGRLEASDAYDLSVCRTVSTWLKPARRRLNSAAVGGPRAALASNALLFSGASITGGSLVAMVCGAAALAALAATICGLVVGAIVAGAAPSASLAGTPG